MQKKEKEYFMTKISDRKEKTYDYIKALEVDENEFPTKNSLDELADIEGERNVAFLIGQANIKVISFKSDFKFCTKVITELEKFYCNDTQKKIYLSGNDKPLNVLNEYINLFTFREERTDEEEYKGKVRKI